MVDRTRALIVAALATLASGGAHATMLRRPGGSIDASGLGATGATDMTQDIRPRAENPMAFPASMDRRTEEEHEHDRSGTGGTGTGSTGTGGTAAPDDADIFDKRHALGEGNSHWDWVHNAHGGSASARNQLIRARNRGLKYFEIMRRSLAEPDIGMTGESETYSPAQTGAETGAEAGAETGTAAIETIIEAATTDAAGMGPAAGDPESLADAVASEATGDANDGFRGDMGRDTVSRGATGEGGTGWNAMGEGTTGSGYSSLTGAQAVLSGRAAMTGGAPSAKFEKVAASESWAEEEAHEAEEQEKTGTSLTCVLVPGRLNARTLSPDAKWCHSFNNMKTTCEKMYVTKLGKGTALCAYDDHKDTCNRGPWSKCKSSSITASIVADNEGDEVGRGTKSWSNTTRAVVDSVMKSAKALLDSGNSSGRSRGQEHKKKIAILSHEQTPLEALDAVEDAMDSLSSKALNKATLVNTASSTASTVVSKEAKETGTSSDKDLDADLQRAFVEATVAESENRHTEKRILNPNDLVTANTKEWTEAGKMEELPPSWQVIGMK